METKPDAVEQPAVRSASRVLDILDALQQAPDGLGLRDLAGASRMPKSSALRYLATLEDRRYVERDPGTGIYRLGLAIPSQAQFFANLSRYARPALERLRDRFDETVTFGALDGDRSTTLEIVESRQPLRLAVDLGHRAYLHSTAIGKAITATLPEPFVRRLVDTSGLPRLTDATITNPDDFVAELARTRELGYALTLEENNVGTCAVAVALPTVKLRAGIGVSAPAIRFREDTVPEIAAALRAEAHGIAEAIDHGPRQ